jgi:hypothetical protein
MSIDDPNMNPYDAPQKPGGSMDGPAPPSGAVTTVAIMNYVFGGLNLLCGGAIAFGGGFLASFIGMAAQEDPNITGEQAAAAAGILGGVVIIIGVIVMIMALPMIVAGFGVTKRAQWGRILTIVLGIVSGLFALLDLVQFNLCGLVLHAGYAATVLIILFNPQFAAEFD